MRKYTEEYTEGVARRVYAAALREGAVRLNRCRVVFVGQGRAGKTSLSRALTGEAFRPDEASTEVLDAPNAAYGHDSSTTSDVRSTGDTWSRREGGGVDLEAEAVVVHNKQRPLPPPPPPASKKKEAQVPASEVPNRWASSSSSHTRAASDGSGGGGGSGGAIVSGSGSPRASSQTSSLPPRSAAPGASNTTSPQPQGPHHAVKQTPVETPQAAKRNMIEEVDEAPPALLGHLQRSLIKDPQAPASSSSSRSVAFRLYDMGGQELYYSLVRVFGLLPGAVYSSHDVPSYSHHDAASHVHPERWHLRGRV